MAGNNPIRWRHRRTEKSIQAGGCGDGGYGSVFIMKDPRILVIRGLQFSSPHIVQGAWRLALKLTTYFYFTCMLLPYIVLVSVDAITQLRYKSYKYKTVRQPFIAVPGWTQTRRF